MGIVNVTPDSFSDGGEHATTSAAIEHGLRLLDEGAEVVDVGGESTRPGAAQVEVEEELRRVVGVVKGLVDRRPDAVVSIDTRRAEVASACLQAGARWVNDVSAGADPEMAGVVAAHGATWVLMHMRGTPATMQHDTSYRDVVGEVCAWLAERVAQVQRQGVDAEQLWVDPGIGFGKALGDNPALVRAVPRLGEATGRPVLVGASRKAFLGHLLGIERPADRACASVGVALAAASHGAGMVRVHDVAATHDALRAFEACR